MKSGPRICITIVVASGLLLECSTVRAQEKVQHRTQTFSVQELFRDQDDAARLNQSSATRSRSDVQGDADSGITTIGTLPAWIFPSFSQAALEPSFGEHFDIIGVKVPEARLQCIPDLDSEEYRRLIEVRNQMWETIIRAFPEIDDWLVGPEPSYSVFVDCKGVPLSVDDLVRFFVDTLEELHLVITAENSEAQMIAHFLGDPWIPIVIRGERVQPSDIRTRMQTEIESRNGLAADYYDQLAEELDSSLVADRSPEYIPPATASSGSDSSNESSSQTRSSHECSGTQVDGWNEKFEEPFDTDVDDLVADTRYSWGPWRTDTTTVHLPVQPVVGAGLEMDGELVMDLPNPADYEKSNSVAGAVTDSSVDVVPVDCFDEVTVFPRRKDRWTAFSNFKAITDTNSGPAHAAVFLRVRDRTWTEDTEEVVDGISQYVSQPIDNQTRFGAFVYGRNTATGCCNVWCGALQITGDDIYAPDHPADGEEGKKRGRNALLLFRVEESAASQTEGETEEGSESEECSGTNLLWDDPTTLYQLRIIEEKRHTYLFDFVLYWKAEVWKHPTTGDPILVGQRDWTSEWEIRILYGIEIPDLVDSKLAIGLGPLDRHGRTTIHVDRVRTDYWIYSDSGTE